MAAPRDLSKRFVEDCLEKRRIWRRVQDHSIAHSKLAISPQNWHITRMAKSKSYSCSDCGAVTNKWSGRCDSCGAWNTISEDTALSSGPSKTSLGAKKGSPINLSNLDTDEAPNPRTQSGIDELDRVLGGGLVPASAILVGGDPGIGKSTLLLQAAAQFARNGLKTIYISGEEASAQVRMRAQRLGLKEHLFSLGPKQICEIF